MFKEEQLNKLQEQGLLEGLLNTLVDKIKGINEKIWIKSLQTTQQT